MNRRYLQIRHRPTGTIIAAGPLGWGITPFEGNYYIRRRYLRDGHFRVDYIPGLCVYKGLYIGLDYVAPNRAVSRHLGWLYWLPNPLLPFVMFRVAVPGNDPLLTIEPVDELTARLRRRTATTSVTAHADPDSITAKPRQPCSTTPR